MYSQFARSEDSRTKREYPKIETLYVRDENFNIDPNQIRNPVWGLINRWEVYEKIDGMNVRVFITPHGKEVGFGGRTDNAQIPMRLVEYLYATFAPYKINEVFFEWEKYVILYGEGYGEGIQSGSRYRPLGAPPSFRLFDVLVIDVESGKKWWLDRGGRETIANKVGVKTAPFLGVIASGPVTSVGLLEVSRETSTVSIEDFGPGCAPEGIVARTEPALFDARGDRLMWKLKHKDFETKGRVPGAKTRVLGAAVLQSVP